MLHTKVVSSYKVKLLSDRNILRQTADKYRAAVTFLTDCIDREWDTVGPIYESNVKYGQRAVEQMVHTTKDKPMPRYDFDVQFYKFPSYLRRAAISAALGAVSSYRSAVENWEAAGKSGKRPALTLDRGVMPAFFRDNMSDVDDMLAGDTDTVRLKLYNGSDWVWHTIPCRHQDVKYLAAHWSGTRACAPVLELKHIKAHTSKGRKRHASDTCYLRFAFEETRDLSLRDVKLEDQVILAVDLGINTGATCSVMTSDGTVTERKFIDFPVEKDRLEHLVNKVKRAQREHGHTGGTREWAKATRCNEDMARKIATAISDFACLHAVNTIVFEHLDTQSKKRGKNKQKLHLWRKNTIQRVVEQKAHRNLMRVSRVCAWGTSKLAFDGSGEVERFISNDGQKKNYSLCMFKNGKQYNCDLGASYNIGARYFLRAWCKVDPKLADTLPTATKRTWADLRTLARKEATAV